MQETYTSFEAAYKHYDEFVKIAKALVKNKEDAEDAVQMAFESYIQYVIDEPITKELIISEIKKAAKVLKDQTRTHDGHELMEEITMSPDTVVGLVDDREAGQLFARKRVVPNYEQQTDE